MTVYPLPRTLPRPPGISAAGPRHDPQPPQGSAIAPAAFGGELAAAPTAAGLIMPRFTDLPDDFCCPYRNGCPYLEGLSTGWVFHRYQEVAGTECQYEYQLKELQQELDRKCVG